MVTQVGEKIAFGTVFGPHLDVGGLFSFLPIHLSFLAALHPPLMPEPTWRPVPWAFTLLASFLTVPHGSIPQTWQESHS